MTEYEYPKRKCLICGSEFTPKRFDSKYCSRECSIKAYTKKKTKAGKKKCENCGKTFLATHGGEKYCSDSCRGTANISRAIASYERRKKPLLPRKCANCGIEFQPRHGSQKYCSKTCNNENRRKTVGIMICPVCKKEFMPTTFNQKYCSKECGKTIWTTTKYEYDYEYEYKKYAGVEKKPKKEKKYASAAVKRWAKMNTDDLLRELAYYGIKYKDAQLMAQNDTLPEDFGKKKKVAR